MKKLFITALLCISVGGSVGAQDIQVVRVESHPMTSDSKLGKGSATLGDLMVSKADMNDPKLFNNFGESRYAALYDFNINTTTKAGDPVTETYVTALRIGDNGAVFTDYLLFKADSISASGISDEEKKKISDETGVVDFFFVPEIVQNIPEGELTVTDQAVVTIGTYTEPFGEIEWNLTGETDTFAGYPVSAATGSYGGREWKVWFTEEIPVAFGPWKLTGLPGLILKAQDSANIHEFKLISFTKSDVPLVQRKKTAEVKTDRDKFIEMKNRTAQNPMRFLNPESISNITVLRSKSGNPAMLVNGVQLRVPVNTFIPLELE